MLLPTPPALERAHLPPLVLSPEASVGRMHFFHALDLGVTGCAVEWKERRLWGWQGWVRLPQEGNKMFPGAERFPGTQVAMWKGPSGGRMILPPAFTLYPIPFRALHHFSTPSCKCPFLLCRTEPGHFCPPDIGLEARLTPLRKQLFTTPLATCG